MVHHTIYRGFGLSATAGVTLLDAAGQRVMNAAFAVQVNENLADLLHRLKFLDESGVNLGMTRLYGRAAPGDRVQQARRVT